MPNLEGSWAIGEHHSTASVSSAKSGGRSGGEMGTAMVLFKFDAIWVASSAWKLRLTGLSTSCGGAEGNHTEFSRPCRFGRNLDVDIDSVATELWTFPGMKRPHEIMPEVFRQRVLSWRSGRVKAKCFSCCHVAFSRSSRSVLIFRACTSLVSLSFSFCLSEINVGDHCKVFDVAKSSHSLCCSRSLCSCLRSSGAPRGRSFGSMAQVAQVLGISFGGSRLFTAASAMLSKAVLNSGSAFVLPHSQQLL